MGINKVLMWIGAIAAALLILGFGFWAVKYGINKGKDTVNEAGESIDNMLETKYTMYDGEIISGSNVVNVISSTFSSSDNIYIMVKTKSNPSGVYYVCSSDCEKLDHDAQRTLVRNSKTKTNANYITPTGKFYGEVERNENGAIVGIVFTQE
jgi:hypothetical protein